jgi:hypothetical protein
MQLVSAQQPAGRARLRGADAQLRGARAGGPPGLDLRRGGFSCWQRCLAALARKLLRGLVEAPAVSAAGETGNRSLEVCAHSVELKCLCSRRAREPRAPTGEPRRKGLAANHLLHAVVDSTGDMRRPWKWSVEGGPLLALSCSGCFPSEGTGRLHLQPCDHTTRQKGT